MGDADLSHLDEHGRARMDGWHAEPTGPQGSHILTSMLGADALAIVPSQTAGVRAGERVEVEPLWRSALVPP